MKKILFALLVVLLSGSAIALDHYYEINLEKEGDIISYRSLNVIPSEGKIQNHGIGYIADIISENNEVLHTEFFGMSYIILYDTVDEKTGEINGGGEIQVNETEKILKLPYFENAQRIRIFDEQMELKLEIDVSAFAKVKAAEEVREEAPIVEEVAESVQPVVTQKKSSINWPIITFSSIMLILLIIIIIIKRK